MLRLAHFVAHVLKEIPRKGLTHEHKKELKEKTRDLILKTLEADLTL